MDTQTPGHGWNDLPAEDKHFFYEWSASAVAATALVILFA